MYRFSPSSIPAAAVPPSPHYLPLNGTSRQQATNLLRRKGAPLVPPLTADEALQIVQYMRLEQFAADTIITFEAQNPEIGRLMLVLAGEVNIRLRDVTQSPTKYSPVDQHTRWANAGEGATLGLVHAFGGLSSRFVAQATTDLFVASLTREALHLLKQNHPMLGSRLMEMLAMELAFIALEHERNLHAMNNVARSMQSMIDAESTKTRPASLE
jgi:CRP/FNR family cyclic AMP-dependent transcriptional regulator